MALIQPRTLLRLEGLLVFLGATAVYGQVQGQLWLYILLFLAPDAVMLFYLYTPEIGAFTYNLVHTYLLPATVIVIGILSRHPYVTQAGLVWAAHIGADRSLQYGLKYENGFKDTHFQRL